MTRDGPGETSDRTYRLRGFSSETGNALIRFRSFDRGERIRRATAGLAKWWAVALGCAFIPVAHFGLVPGFLVFGALVCLRRLKTGTVVVAARGTCPDCGTEQDLDVVGPWRGGGDLACRQCHRSLRLAPG